MNIATAAFGGFEGPMRVSVRVVESLDDRERRLKCDGPLRRSLGDDYAELRVYTLRTADGREMIYLALDEVTSALAFRFLSSLRAIGVPGDATVELEIAEASISGSLDELLP